MTTSNSEFNLSEFVGLSRQELWGHLFTRRIKDVPYNSEAVFIYFSDFFGGHFMGLDGRQYKIDGQSFCGKYEIVAHVKSHGSIIERANHKRKSNDLD